MKNLTAALLFLTCITLSTPSFGLSAAADIKPPQPAAIDSAQAIDNLAFTGVVKKLDEGTALFTEKEIYPLIGGDFEMIVGKEVTIIGKVVKEGDADKLSVARVQFEKK